MGTPKPKGRLVTPLARALLEELRADPDALRELAEALAPFLPAPEPAQDRWLTSAEAALHLGLSKAALHRLTAARAIPFEQDGPGARCWFKHSQLDAWRRAGGAAEHPLSRAQDG